MKEEIANYLTHEILFEINDEETRNKVKEGLTCIASKFSDEVLVVCDESNNPVESINNNELHVDIYHRKLGSDNFHVLNVSIVRTTIKIQEVVGKND